MQRDKDLATLGLSLHPTLLYLLGAIDDPKEAWDMLGEQYYKRTWANRFELRKKLHSLRLREGGSVQDHVRQMTELFSGFADVDSPLTDEDKVIYLLASLPESYGVLVTKLESLPEVPKLAIVTERLLHQKRKLTRSC